MSTPFPKMRPSIALPPAFFAWTEPQDLGGLNLSTKDALAQVRPELVPHVADESAEQAGRTADDGLPRRGHARRQPRILDHVIQGIAGVTSPRRGKATVAAWSEHDRLRGVPDARSHG